MRRSVIAAIALVCLALVAVAGPALLFSPGAEDVAPEEEADPADPKMLSFEDADSEFWPYLNAREEFEHRSAINVIVRGDTETVLTVLTQEAQWNVTPDVHEANESEPEILAQEGGHATGFGWGEAAGTKRVTYVDPGPAGEPTWIEETAQIEDGDYYGHRYHIRLYESPNPEDEWVAMQAHTEHFDWLTLRHRVTGIEEAQAHVERDLMAAPGLEPGEDVVRIWVGNDGPYDSDGWATYADLREVRVVPVANLAGFGWSSPLGWLSLGSLALGSLLLGAGVLAAPLERARQFHDERLTSVDRDRLRAARDRVTIWHLLLFLAMAGIVLFVRVAGIALERHVGFLSMHGIAALLYPVMALGLPIAAYALSTRLSHRRDAGLTAAFGFATGMWLDYAFLGVEVLPLDVVLQRFFVVVALGLIAAGAADRATRERRLNGLVLWGVVLWVTLLGAIILGLV